MSECKIIDMVNEQEQEKPKFKDRAKEKVQKTWKFVKENKEIVIPVATGVISGVCMVGKAILRNESVKAERHMKDCCIYDRSKGHWVESKRKIKNSEWLQIDQRHEEGESYTNILDDMGLLKR